MTEKLKFKIGLSGTYWDKQPQWCLLVDGAVVASGVASDSIEYVEFEQALAEGKHVLSIALVNKTDTDTVENEDKTAIVKDMLLNIESVEIDGIDLEELIRTKSEFVGVDATRPILDNCVNLGWNGHWNLSFESPFYLWLLENM
jgi:hypothetical protein